MSDAADPRRERPELAAYCGPPAAELDLSTWLRGLERFGLEATVRAAHVAAKSVVHFWNERPDPGLAYLGEASPGEQVAAVSEWLDCPCEDHVGEALRTLPTAPLDLPEEHRGTPHAAAHAAAEAAVLTLRRPAFVASAGLHASVALGGRDAEPRVLELCRAALLRWALGTT